MKRGLGLLGKKDGQDPNGILSISSLLSCWDSCRHMIIIFFTQNEIRMRIIWTFHVSGSCDPLSSLRRKQKEKMKWGWRDERWIKWNGIRSLGESVLKFYIFFRITDEGWREGECSYITAPFFPSASVSAIWFQSVIILNEKNGLKIFHPFQQNGIQDGQSVADVVEKGIWRKNALQRILDLGFSLLLSSCQMLGFRNGIE